MKQTMKAAALTIFLLVFLSASTEGYDEDKAVQNFLKKLEAANYDKRSAPQGNGGPGSPVDVVISSYILDIRKVDDMYMGFNAHFYFRQSWNDSRLEHRENPETITLRDESAIWTPDLFFVEEREGSIHQIMHPNKFINIKPNGEVKYSAKLSVTFQCPMDLRYYPHDIQKCIINIESYAFQKHVINLEWQDPYGGYSPVSASEDIAMLDFDLIEVTPSSRIAKMSFGEYKSLQIHLKFKRRFGFFATRLYVPFIILVLMSSLSLWIKAEEKCLRLCLLLVILFLMVTISSEVNDWIPPAPYTKASDVWIAFCESLVFAAFLEFIVVAVIAGRKNDNSKGQGELLPTLDPQSKDIDMSSESMKSPFSRFINMFDARYGGRGKANPLAYRIDKICRIMFPLAFILFNIVYWSAFSTA